jgi:hypothetical protein
MQSSSADTDWEAASDARAVGSCFNQFFRTALNGSGSRPVDNLVTSNNWVERFIRAPLPPPPTHFLSNALSIRPSVRHCRERTVVLGRRPAPPEQGGFAFSGPDLRILAFPTAIAT